MPVSVEVELADCAFAGNDQMRTGVRVLGVTLLLLCACGRARGACADNNTASAYLANHKCKELASYGWCNHTSYAAWMPQRCPVSCNATSCRQQQGTSTPSVAQTVERWGAG